MTSTAGNVLEIEHLSKTFASVKVLKDVSLSVRAGEIHALLGQNGSGKSTIIKILSGYHDPDPGATVRLRGEEMNLPIKPHDIEGVVSFVHQDLGFVDELSILDTLRVGRWSVNPGRIHWRRERKQVRAALADFDMKLDPDRLVGTLSQAEKAVLGIVRGLDQLGETRNGLLVLDEPTASLPRGDVHRLFDAVRAVAARGLGVVFVTHRLDEVETYADRATVIRDGRIVGTSVIAETNADALVTQILGSELTELYPDTPPTSSEVVMEVRNLSGVKAQNVSFRVHKGEIVGLTGLAGMGQDEIPYMVFGAMPPAAGEIHVSGRRVRFASPREAVRAGIALIPANRKRDGSVGAASVAENISLPVLRRLYRGGRLRRDVERRSVKGLIDRFEVNPRDPARQFATLSGGNQQKAVLAKWMQMDPPVIMLHEPTQGVDIGSCKQIFSAISEAARGGAGVLIVSGEYEDLAHLCERVLVFRDGQVAAELSSGGLSHDRIVEQSYKARR